MVEVTSVDLLLFCPKRIIHLLLCRLTTYMSAYKRILSSANNASFLPQVKLKTCIITVAKAKKDSVT